MTRNESDHAQALADVEANRTLSNEQVANLRESAKNAGARGDAAHAALLKAGFTSSR